MGLPPPPPPTPVRENSIHLLTIARENSIFSKFKSQGKSGKNILRFLYQPCTWILRFRGENLSANQIARFFKLVYLLNCSTVFCIVLYDSRKPLGEETEYVLAVIGG